MTTPSTYAEIVEKAQESLSETGQDFVDFIPTAIGLATDRLNRELDILATSTEKHTETATIGDRLLSKPTKWNYTRSIFLESTNGEEKLLEKKTDDYLRDFWPNPSTTGEPIYYAEWDGDEIMLAPTPDSAYKIHYTFGQDQEPVSSTNPTNKYTEKCPDVYYKAVLLELAMYLKMYSKIPLYGQDYEASKNSLNNEGRRSRVDDGDSVEVNNTQNTLMPKE